MSNETCVKIEIIKAIPFFGEGDSLETRLRNMSLRGFPDVKIYENASFKYEFLTPKQIVDKIHTPQPSIYKTHLDKIDSLNKLFLEKGINILNLDNAYDYIGFNSKGSQTEWTILSPVTETFEIPKNIQGQMDYSSLIGSKLSESLKEKGLGFNQEVLDLPYPNSGGPINLINDGSHRVHYGFENGGIKILKITGMTQGFPYYAAPQKYSKIKVHKERDDSAIETKIHVVDAPGHKDLYRLFPSGGIMSGSVRSDKKITN